MADALGEYKKLELAIVGFNAYFEALDERLV